LKDAVQKLRKELAIAKNKQIYFKVIGSLFVASLLGVFDFFFVKLLEKYVF
jgi:hypothetical protein